MKELTNIPTTKVERATKFIKTGAKLGVNYLKHYTKNIVSDAPVSRQQLDQDNAKDIFDALSEMKGSVLKLLQMLSMEKNFLPAAYTEKFADAQYRTPPLSAPLVVKTFVQSIGQPPSQLFDTFNVRATSAASIGQVHQATKNSKQLAVKIQYPGVANAIHSDIQMVKPIAFRVMGLPEIDFEKYLQEVETKLIEETNYTLELKRSMTLSDQCRHLKNLVFPQYYPELSSSKIITMDWIEGLHLKEFLMTNPPQSIRNQIGQALWDFYDFQVHTLKTIHADPHPGNFIIQPDGNVGVIDFGCVKEIPNDFYTLFFSLVLNETLDNPKRLQSALLQAEILFEDDTPQKKAFYMDLFKENLRWAGKPFQNQTFDFGDASYMTDMQEMGNKLMQNEELKKERDARGSTHFIYINRTYFGLYALLNELGANIETRGLHFIKPKK